MTETGEKIVGIRLALDISATLSTLHLSPITNVKKQEFKNFLHVGTLIYP